MLWVMGAQASIILEPHIIIDIEKLVICINTLFGYLVSVVIFKLKDSSAFMI